MSKHSKSNQNPSSERVIYTDNSYLISKDIDINTMNLKLIFNQSDDIIFREIVLNMEYKIKALICFIDGLEDKKLINESIINPLLKLHNTCQAETNKVEYENLSDIIKKQILNSSEVIQINDFNKVIHYLLRGSSALFIDGYSTVLCINVKLSETRESKAAETEGNVRGPRFGFSEVLRVNTAILRRIIQSPKLTFETLIIGNETHTDISIAYINGIADEKLIKEVKERLYKINADSVLESGYIEQLIEDHKFSPFSTVGNSEKPDKVASKLLEGRVAILCNGTPFVLTAPFLFVESLQTTDDYNMKPFMASLTRLLRLLALLISLMLPALYVALTAFHPEMFPTILLITISSSREGTPFPIIIETLLTETIFQLLRESGIRMPQAIGSAISIVGTLVIGEAAVNAGIIGAPMVIIVSLTAITSFAVPAIFDSMLLFRFLLIILSGLFGLFGIAVGSICMLAHMCSLESFGTPYMTPLAPRKQNSLKDTVVRFPFKPRKNKSYL